MSDTGDVIRGPWKGATPGRERELTEALELCEGAMSDLMDMILEAQPPEPDALAALQFRYEKALTTARLVLQKKITW